MTKYRGFLDRSGDDDLLSLSFAGTQPLLDWLGWESVEGDLVRFGRLGPSRHDGRTSRYTETYPRFRLDGKLVSDEAEWDYVFATEILIIDLLRVIPSGNSITVGQFNGLQMICQECLTVPLESLATNINDKIAKLPDEADYALLAPNFCQSAMADLSMPVFYSDWGLWGDEQLTDAYLMTKAVGDQRTMWGQYRDTRKMADGSGYATDCGFSLCSCKRELIDYQRRIHMWLQLACTAPELQTRFRIPPPITPPKEGLHVWGVGLPRLVCRDVCQDARI